MNWPFAPLSEKSFDGVMIDPPWAFTNFSAKGWAKNANAHYQCMDLASIKSLPIVDLAKKDCWIWLWATHPMREMAHDCLKAWGVKYVTAGEWVKFGNKLAFGTGYVLRSSSEPYLIGKIGNPKPMSRSLRNTIMAPRREHSRKPDEAYAQFRALCGPDARIADLFARESRFDFEPWGNEIQKFSEAAE